MITVRMMQNAHKFAYLVNVYPEKEVPKVIDLFRISPVDINCAVWAAMENGIVSAPTPENPFVKLLRAPKEWDFGDDEAELENALLYTFEKLNAEEKDMEENYMHNWSVGYLPQDVLIAVKRLLEKGLLHEYQIEDGESAYIFYTLTKNAGKNWGSKQFKIDPLTGEDRRTPEEKAADEKMQAELDRKLAEGQENATKEETDTDTTASEQ